MTELLSLMPKKEEQTSNGESESEYLDFFGVYRGKGALANVPPIELLINARH